MSLSLGVPVPGLADPASVNEVFHHLLEPGKMEIPADPGEGCGDSHVSSFLGVGVKKDLVGHFVRHANLGFFFS